MTHRLKILSGHDVIADWPIEPDIDIPNFVTALQHAASFLVRLGACTTAMEFRNELRRTAK